ncbi:hypothetical protein MKW92_010580 [Papaver armeniacum]|nr:hypothetical protein MKW92_010580 [Papaver armeniacum]
MGLVIVIIAIMVVYFNNYSVSFVNSASSSSLSVGFYDESCPRVEDIIYDELVKKMSPIPRNITIPGTLRLFFHDCYVQGCDGSVLILPTDDNNSERNASINLSLAGDACDIVDKAKVALEKECPGVVSCSDILAILARDVVHWKGRRDGLISNATEAQLLMPKSDENITTLIRGSKSIGLSTVLHCIEFASRIFHNDTTLNSTIREKVILSCPFPKIDENFVFDNKFYKSLRQRKVLLFTDHVLAFGENDVSRKLVYRYSEDQELFFQEFAKAVVKLGRVGVKTGNEGEIRRDCKKFN